MEIMKKPKIKSIPYEDFIDNESLEKMVKELNEGGANVFVGVLDDLINWGRSNSLWPLTFATSCCGIEFMALGAARYDMARFGLLALRGGTWDGREVVPASWIDHGRRPRSVDPDDGWIHGAHWWVVGDDLGSFWANGYEGQAILCVPGLDLVVVRLGRSPATASGPLRRWRSDVVDAFRAAGPPVTR